jgi:hypothetical protein
MYEVMRKPLYYPYYVLSIIRVYVLEKSTIKGVQKQKHKQARIFNQILLYGRSLKKLGGSMRENNADNVTKTKLERIVCGNTG